MIGAEWFYLNRGDLALARKIRAKTIIVCASKMEKNVCNHACAPVARTKRFVLRKSPVREGNTVQ